MFMAFTGALTFESLTSLYAQVATNYTFSQSTGTFTPVTGGTVLGNASTDDQRFVAVSSPLGSTTVPM